MHETIMTVVGNLVDAPTLRRTKNGHAVANFRVASTQRRFDRETKTWGDGDKLFVQVTAWRALAENVVASLNKGTPVVVIGRYYQRDYEKDEQLRVAYELEASAVGPDLNRGTARWDKVDRPANPQFDTDETGGPVDCSTDYLDLDDTGELDQVDRVDVVTGEVRELAPV